MTKDRYGPAANLVFKALADPTRRQVLEALGASDLPAGEIASHFPISGPSVSRHLGVLRSAGLVQERRQANKVIYSIVPERISSVLEDWLGAVCRRPPTPHDPFGTEERSRHKKKGAKSAKGKRKAPTDAPEAAHTPGRPAASTAETANEPPPPTGTAEAVEPEPSSAPT